jgi:signal transduction histidine kinase
LTEKDTRAKHEPTGQSETSQLDRGAREALGSAIPSSIREACRKANDGSICDSLSAMRRDLHDIVGATLVGIAMQLEYLSRTRNADHRKVETLVTELRGETADLIDYVRSLAHGRAVPQVEDVEVALRAMIDRFNRNVGPRLIFTLNYDPAVDLAPANITSAAFWIIREAVANVLVHSRARKCSVSLAVSGDFLIAKVEDDGTVLAGGPGGMGLASIAARAAEQGGWCYASPSRPAGFSVVASLPMSPDGPGDGEPVPW